MVELTAIEWFLNQIETKFYASENVNTKKIQINIEPSIYLELKNKAKAMEKEQILNACYQFSDYPFNKEDHLEYYNETYNK